MTGWHTSLVPNISDHADPVAVIFRRQWGKHVNISILSSLAIIHETYFIHDIVCAWMCV